MSKKRFYKLEYSNFIIDEFERLRNGSKDEQQRFRQAQQAVAKIQSNPINEEFRKDLPDNYKAAKVLGQYRLFFIIHNLGEDTGIVFLTWVNDEKSIHASGESNDAYQVFRDLVSADEVEKYEPPVATGSPKCNQHGSWGESCIYFDLEQSRGDEAMWAKSHLYLSSISENEYRIESVSVSHPNEKLAKNLVSYICEAASIAKITLYYELDTKKPDLEKNYHLLNSSGFVKVDELGDDEVWEKKP